jgi:hypothetical protein
MSSEESLKSRQQFIGEADEKGIIATPANSYINELVVEAARMSITADGTPVKILYGDHPRVEFR